MAKQRNIQIHPCIPEDLYFKLTRESLDEKLSLSHVVARVICAGYGLPFANYVDSMRKMHSPRTTSSHLAIQKEIENNPYPTDLKDFLAHPHYLPSIFGIMLATDFTPHWGNKTPITEEEKKIIRRERDRFYPND